jgi:hypothetical protein
MILVILFYSILAEIYNHLAAILKETKQLIQTLFFYDNY